MEHDRDQCDTLLHGVHGTDVQGIYEQALIIESPLNVHLSDDVHCSDNDFFPFAFLSYHTHGIFQWC